MFFLEHLNPEIRWLIQGLIVFHVLIIILYLWALWKNWNVSQKQQIEDFAKKSKKTN